MGLVNSALNIGRSAVTSYQSALSVVGNNIANAANPDYTRQRAVLQPVLGAALPQGVRPGGGVALTSLERIVNEALEDRLRLALGDSQSERVQSTALSQIETAFNALSDNDLSSLMGTLFNSFQDIQNNPTVIGLRGVTIGQAAALADAIRARRQGLENLIDEANTQIGAATVRANELAEQIADLNVKIVEAEAGDQIAGALRDSRDALLRELGELMQITVRSQDSGTVSVFIGNETLVQFGRSRGPTNQTVVDGDFERVEVHFADDNGQADIRGGQIAGLIEARDTHIVRVIAGLDRVAAGSIEALNEVHSNGQGLAGFETLTGTAAVNDADLALNDAATGLAVAPQTGSFFIAVSEKSSGQTVSFRIDIDLDGQNNDDTTLNTLAAQINATASNVTATVGVDNKLTLTVPPGFELTFGHDGAGGRDDTSNVLSALGMNTFFQGTDARDIGVNDLLVSRPELLAGSRANITGDGSNAGRLAEAANVGLGRLNGDGVLDFYNRTLGELGVQSAAASARFESANASLTALQQQRASISGVNLDEEAIELLRYERAFQGAARFTSVVDRLISELLAIVR